MGEPQRSRTLLLSAPEDQLDVPALLVLVGESLLALDEYEVAVKTAERLTLMDQDNPEADFQLARAYAATGRLDQAEQALARGLALNGGHKPASLVIDAMLGSVYGTAERLALIERVTASPPLSPVSRTPWARCLCARGNWTEVWGYWKTPTAEMARSRPSGCITRTRW